MRTAALAASVALVLPAATATAEIIFESGTLGPTGIAWDDVLEQVTPSENVSRHAFTGVRFELGQPAIVEKVGGHFVGPPNQVGTFFGAIVQLEDESDFPDSDDLSTPDVLGTTTIPFPEPSAEVYGEMSLPLDRGWCGLVFGGALFGAVGSGGAPLNNSDLGSPSYIGFLSGFGWGHRLPDKRFVVRGLTIPEPPRAHLTLVAFLLLRLWERSHVARRLA